MPIYVSWCVGSGGDLDGDLYSLIWDQRLVPSDTWPPLDYAGVLRSAQVAAQEEGTHTPKRWLEQRDKYVGQEQLVKATVAYSSRASTMGVLNRLEQPSSARAHGCRLCQQAAARRPGA